MANFRLFILAAALGSGVFGFAQPVLAEGAGSPEATVEERLETLEQKQRILERRWELEQESTQAKVKETPILGAGKEGFFLMSADGAFQLKLRGYLQADGRFFLDVPKQTDTFLLRRVRPIFEGTVFKYFDFRIMPDFAGGRTVLFDAYLDAHPWPEARLQVGKFKPPVGLERLQSATDLRFVERALPTNLVPTRDVGVQLHGDLWNGAFSYALGVFNGVPDGGNGDLDIDSDKDFAGRLFVHPLKNSEVEPLQSLGVGVAGTWGDQRGNPKSPNLPAFITPGQQTFFNYRSDGTAAGTTIADGVRFRISPQAYYYWGPFGLLGEYVLSSQKVRRGAAVARLEHEAWQVAVSYVLTGEEASYRGVKPKRPFDLRNGAWGALEVAARYSQLHVDGDAFPVFADPIRAAKEARAWAVGINWYLNQNVKIVMNYEQTDFNGGSSTGDREDEKVILSRFQIAF